MILLPNTRDGLQALIDGLSPNNIFYFTPNRLTSGFNFQSSKADFNHITTEEKAYIGKLEQYSKFYFFDDEGLNSEDSENASSAINTLHSCTYT